MEERRQILVVTLILPLFNVPPKTNPNLLPLNLLPANLLPLNLLVQQSPSALRTAQYQRTSADRFALPNIVCVKCTPSTRHRSPTSPHLPALSSTPLRCTIPPASSCADDEQQTGGSRRRARGGRASGQCHP
eukprot:60490-Rhodomonas_salina.2